MSIIKLDGKHFIKEASYIIFIGDDRKTYALNGKTGATEFSGTDASTVIQGVINIV